MAVALFHLVVEVILVYGLFCWECLFKLAMELSVASIIHIIIRIFLQCISLWLFEHIWGEARLECSFFMKVTQVIALSVDLRLSSEVTGIWRSRLKEVMIIWLDGDGWSLVSSSSGL